MIVGWLSEMEFSLKEILQILIKRFVLITICTFAGACIFFGISKYVIKPSYQSFVKMYVSASQSEVTSSADLNELNYAQKVVTTYISFLQTNVFYNEVLNDCKLNYTKEQIMSMTTIESVNDTEIFKINITSTNPNDAYKIIQSMQNIAPILISSIKPDAVISVVDPGFLPKKPYSPNVMKNTLTGGLFGFVLSVMLSLLIEILDIKVKSSEDVEKKYQVPILGEIPDFDSNKTIRIKMLQRLFDKDKKLLKSETILNKNSQFMITEAYKMCRSNLNFTLRFDGCKKIAVTSATPQEGKSTTVANIGISIAQTGAKVLLMDCDLRKGTLHRLFNIKMRPGVSDALSGLNDAQSVICKTAYENLFVIPIGTVPPNPSELLSSVQMEELLMKLNNQYDYIIIDTPPVKVVSDALNLVKMVDGLLLVVRESTTTHPNISAVLTKLGFLKANVLGFVLNGMSMNSKEKSKYQKYY